MPEADSSGSKEFHEATQSDAPIAMLQAVRAVVHEGHTPAQGLEAYETLRREPEALA